jgi:hypothetical protein
MRAIAFAVIVLAVLPNTLTAGHWGYLAAGAVEQHEHAGEHDHSGHQTVVPAAQTFLVFENDLTALLRSGTLRPAPGSPRLSAESNLDAPPSPPPRSV